MDERLAANALTAALVAGRTDSGGDDLAEALAAAAPAACGCPGCLHAASPLAYLANLLDYAVRRLRENGQPVTLERLAERFHQPFADVPVACGPAETEVAQPRIAVEVLRAFLQVTEEPSWYLQDAYEALLRGIGTSLDEVRAARTAKHDDRRIIAERIGLRLPAQHPAGSTDQLDELFDPMTSAGRSETRLEQLFGLRSTLTSSLYGDVLPDASMVTWRRHRLREDWTAQDHPATVPAGTPPIIEPDHLGSSDFADLSGSAYKIWVHRDVEVTGMRAIKKETREKQGLDVLLGDWTTSGLWQNTTVAALLTLADRRAAGQTIDPEVAGLGLDVAEFDELAAVIRLESTGSVVSEREWENFYAILVVADKRAHYPLWRQEEVTPPAYLGPLFPGPFPILVSPFYFRLRLPDAVGWQPSASRRSDPAIRAAWERRLHIRFAQEDAVLADLRALVRSVEERLLPTLRDYLLDRLRFLPAVPPGTPDRPEWLGRRLQIDFKAGGGSRVDRVTQAVTTVQGIIFGARNGVLEDRTFTLDAPRFDDEWTWLSRYSTWRAAMLVFLYPESALQPSLRRAVSPGFAALVRRLPAWATIDPTAAQAAADEYAAYFTDVCSLTLAGVLDRATTESAGARRVTRIARAATGRLYASAHTRRATLLPRVVDETFWTALPGPDRPADLTGLIRYRAALGPARIGAYTRWYDRQGAHHDFATTDGFSWTTPQPVDGIPPLVCTGDLADAVAPTARPVAADLDGSGRPQIVTLSGPDANDRRTLHVAREEDGGLVTVDRTVLEAGWELPDRPAVFRTGGRDRLLVVNRTTSRIGVLGRNPAGQVTLLWQVADVLRADGTSGWPVAFGMSDQTTVFVAANIDGFGRRLLVFERRPSGNSYCPIETVATVCDWVGDRFTFLTQQLIQFNGPADITTSTGFSVRWDQFLPVTTSYGPQGFENNGRQDILVHTVRTEWWTWQIGDPPRSNEETRAWLRLLRWDRNALAFQALFVSKGESIVNPGFGPPTDIPGVGGTAAWRLGIDDEFSCFDAEPGGRRAEILVRNPSRGAVGVLSVTGVNTVNVHYHAETAIGGLALGSGQRWTAVDLDGDGRQHLLVTDGGRRELTLINVEAGTLTLSAQATLTGRVEAPDLNPARAWAVTGDAAAVTADVDLDGRQELVVRDANGRLLLLRAVPAPVTPTGGPPVAPRGVTLLDIRPKRLAIPAADRRARIKAAYDATVTASSGLDLALLDEAYYFVPVELALRLQTAGAFGAALDWFASVYDHAAPVADRKVAAKLIREDGPLATTLTQSPDWLADPLSPHAIAATRPNAYTRFTVLAVVRCLLGWADSEFAGGSAETVARARELYLFALELLRAPELLQRLPDCADLFGRLTIGIGDPELDNLLATAVAGLTELRSRDAVEAAIARIEAAWDGVEEPADRVAIAARLVAEAEADERPPTMAEVQQADRRMLTAARVALLDGGRPGDAEPEWAEALHVTATFCVPPEQTAESLRQHADLALRRIRSARTIAGLATSAAGYQPLPYRYATLVERARQLVQLAAQAEAAMFDAVRLGEAAAYDELRARQDLEIQRAGVRLQELEVTRATDLAALAGLQRDRTTAQRQYLDVLYRREYDKGTTRIVLSYVNLVIAIIKLIASVGASGGASGAQAATAAESAEIKGAVDGVAGAFVNWTASIFDAAERARAMREQMVFADRDVGIAEQQVRVADDGVRLAAQQQVIAAIRADQAQAVVTFLSQRFAGPELYDWMSRILQDVYRYFLQQAASYGRLAEAQLAAERRAEVPAFIARDYWSTTAALPGGDAPEPDRRGLTGSARLLRDLVALDDHAFRSRQRRLQLTRTLSLAALDPLGFAAFRRTGVIYFATPTELFDRDFPGHYLRLVTQVRVTVIALVPPGEGIRATLATSGISYLVTPSGDGFERTAVARPPETATFTGPAATELDPQAELLRPFENTGADTTWRFVMPQPANPLPFTDIADVLVTIDYTALDSPDLRRRVLDARPSTVVCERVISFRFDRPDQWYDLHNPDQTPAPLRLRFRTERTDFAPHLRDLVLRQVTLVYLPIGGTVPAGWATALGTELGFGPDGGTQVGAPPANPVDGVITTRPGPGNVAGWQNLTATAPPPIGDWAMRLAPSAQAVIDSGELDDIVLVLTYEATSPPWPDQD